MSHVWGQTVPSNYGRLPATRQKVFNTLADDLVQQGGEKVLKEIQQKSLKEVTEELGEKVLKDLTPEVQEQVMKKTLKEVGEDASPEVIEKAFKKNLKETGQKMGKEVTGDITVKATREMTEEDIEKLLKNAPETAIERLGKRAITVGGIGVTGFAMFNSLLNSDALDDYVSSTTGRDCDEKAVEAGYEPGTQEYTDRVNECQEKAVENMAFLGKAMTYGGLGLATLVVVSVLGKMGIFSGSGSKEESDDEE